MGSTSYLTDASGEVYQHLEYLPFGETLVEEHYNSERNPYLYNGKELDEETGLYYYGARYYDAQIACFHAIDPKAEDFVFQSPYVYGANNPILFVDKNGENAGEYEKDENNNWVKVSNKGDVYGIDFYHMDFEDAEGNDIQETLVFDNEGNMNVISGGRDALKGETRDGETNWSNIFDEWIHGTGPENSYFEGNHPSNLLIKDNFLYKDALEKFKNASFLNKELSKKAYEVNFGIKALATSNDQVQMMGSYNASFYKLGDKTLILIQDSKSRSSFYYHLVKTNHSRNDDPIHNVEANTYQTYLFLD